MVGEAKKGTPAPSPDPKKGTPGPYGEKFKYDPKFRGPIRKRSCTDIICCVIFLVFIMGYIVVGFLAWLYGDPRQVMYPRNTTGSYCGIGENRNKPYLFYFNIMNCLLTVKSLSVGGWNGIQCPTTQICVATCPDKFWVLPTIAFVPGTKPQAVWNQSLCKPGLDLATTTLTVSDILNQQLCPEFIVPSQPFFLRCFPHFDASDAGNFNVSGLPPNKTKEFIESSSEKLLESLNIKNVGLKIFEDFLRCWYWILIALLIAMGLSLLFLLLLRFTADFLVWFLIMGMLAITSYGIYYSYNEYRILKANGATIQTIGFTTNFKLYGSVKETWLAILIILCVLLAIMVLIIVFLRKRISIAIELIKEASRAIGYMMSCLLYPLLTFSLIVICVVYWGTTALYLATSGSPLYRVVPTNASDPNCNGINANESCNPLEFDPSHYSPCPTDCFFYKYNDEGLFQTNIFNLQIYNILGFLWCINFVIALGQCVLAGAFASYYWALKKPNDIPTCAVASSFVRTLRYHVGSLAFGSLILTIVQAIRLILEYLDNKLREAENPLTRCLMCCLKCCFWCLEKFIKFLNRNAYIMIAIYGKNFCTSAKNAFMLLMRNILRVVVLDKITDLLLLFGKLLVVGGVGLLSFFFFSGRIPISDTRFQSPGLNYYWVPLLTVVVGSYLIAQGFFSVYSMCIDTLFLCFLEDLERNDGSAEKPYYMSKSLMTILNKKNKK